MAFLGPFLIFLLSIAAPIGVALCAATVVFILFDPSLSASATFRSFFSFLNSYTLMAIPFFILAGFLMEATGLIDRLFKFADALVGWVPGGFAYATLLSAIMFGAISGSSTAMSAAMGVVAYPEMVKRGYPKWMAAGVIATGGGIALLIPPSITLILYGVLTEESIPKLFFAGVTPGIMLAISDACVILIVAWIIKLPAGKFVAKDLWTAFKGAWPGLLMPVIVLGGLYGGVFTPTEAGAAACAYALTYGICAGHGKRSGMRLPSAVINGLSVIAIVSLLIFGFVSSAQTPAATWLDANNMSPIGVYIASGVLTALALAVLSGWRLGWAGDFIKKIIPTTTRAVNLTSIVFFVLGSVGIFQFLLANKGWPQDMAEWVIGFGLSPTGFLFLLMGVLLCMSMFLTGVAILVLVVPIIYPVSQTLGIDPIHLGILFALCVEMGAVIPPVGLNLFAVSGTTGVPVTQVMRGSFPFLCTDSCVLILVLLFPAIAMWLPDIMVVSVFAGK